MSAGPDYRIERLTPARRDDYLRFFDHEHGPAFADNPDWAKCYCHFYEVPVAIAWGSLDGAANRLAMDARIACGEMEGYLAYVGDDAVGWMNAQPRHKLQHACARLKIPPPALPVPPHEAAAIVCFVVAPPWRRRGVARTLLDFGLADFAVRGIRIVDAFPWNTGPDDTATTDHYHGSPALFAAAGFTPLAVYENVTLVRRALP